MILTANLTATAAATHTIVMRIAGDIPSNRRNNRAAITTYTPPTIANTTLAPINPSIPIPMKGVMHHDNSGLQYPEQECAQFIGLVQKPPVSFMTGATGAGGLFI